MTVGPVTITSDPNSTAGPMPRSGNRMYANKADSAQVISAPIVTRFRMTVPE